MAQAGDQPTAALWGCPSCNELIELLGEPRAPECKACAVPLEQLELDLVAPANRGV
jgi:ABC-type ATPase with predicted acetyltransferase domain